MSNITAIDKTEEISEHVSVDIFTVSTPAITSVVQVPNSVTTMPQESVAQNVANDDAATLPLPTPSYIPPHILYGNIDNDTDDSVLRGKKPMKPRLGVKVPYRNLISQIVTRNELAQELLERSLKKYPPIHEPPEGGDIFFAIKLTQRLANHIVPPSSATTSSSSAMDSASTTPKTTLCQLSDTALSENNTPVQEQKVIADDKELLAILEGDVDPNWIPEIKASSQSSVQPCKISAGSPPKLDPLLEKELALKQLMEFETTPRKKKTDSQDEKSERKPKKKMWKPDGALGESNGNIVPAEGRKLAQKSETSQLNKKPIRKRKTPVEEIGIAKKQKLSAKRKSENVESGKVTKSKVTSLPKHPKKLNRTDKIGTENIANVIESVVSSFSENQKTNDTSSMVQNMDKSNMSSEASVQTIIVDQEESVPASDISTPKDKMTSEAPVLPTVADQENTASASDISNSKNLEKYPDSSETDSQRETNISKENSEEQKCIDVPSGGKKRVRRTEIDKLLIDEGAINLLYEAELGDSRRRSTAYDSDPSNSEILKRPVNPKVNSSRWKKKNLILKTRLVKNAVLRLKSLQNPPVNLRTKKLLVRSPEQVDNDNKMAPPKVVDSREQLRSPPTVHFDPPSLSQPLPCPPRSQLRAEASRIIRRHSSSSNFSSRSTSPTVLPRINCDVGIQTNSSSNGQIGKGLNKESQHDKLVVKQGTAIRKKGVPIFVRKVEDSQTYRGKKKNEKEHIVTVTLQKDVTNANKYVKHSSAKISVNRIVPKLKTLQKDNETNVSSNVLQNLSGDKTKLKPELVKGLQKNVQKEKNQKLERSVEQHSVVKVKKKDKLQKEESLSTTSAISDSTGVKFSTPNVETELTTCLAEAASAFAAEGTAVRRSTTDGSAGTGNSVQKKEISRSHPQSPNAASYNSLVKSLESDIQKQKRKDDAHTKSRTSIRQNAGIISYRELSIRRYDGLVQIIMNPASTKMKNALNLQVLRELRGVLLQMRRDDSCRAVLLTSTGGLFCQGVDLYCLLHLNSDRRKIVAQEFAVAIKDFVRALAHFNKPLIAGVNGAAMGLGVTILPFFDMVIASDKATFYTPYAKLGQVPEGGATMTFQYMFGNCLTSELLFGCRRITASEALHFGLVTRILWPDRFQEELIPIARGVSSQSAQAMETTKALLRHGLRTKLEASLESEMHLLVQHWCLTECQNNVRRFLEAYEEIGLQRQRIDPDL